MKMNYSHPRSSYKTILAAAFLLIVMWPQPGTTGIKEAREAYEKRDYAEALKEYERLAGQGNVDAQGCLGDMYEMGQGVEQDCKKAAYWYRKAAKRGYRHAQFS